MSRRLPKRGFRNLFKKEFAIVNIKQLEVFAAGETVDEAGLRLKGIIKGKRLPIKLLGIGEIDRSLIVKVDHLSQTARQKIEAAGGRIIEGE